MAQAILRLCEDHQIRLIPQFVPGHLNVVADSLSRCSQVLGSEWTLCHHRPLCDFLNSSSSGVLLSGGGSTVSGHGCHDAALGVWGGLQAYAFSPFSLLHRVLLKVWQSRGLELTLVAPFWPQRPWFLELLVAVPVFLPQRRGLVRQPHFHRFRQNLHVLRLTAFRISNDPRDPSDSLWQWLVSLPAAEGLPPE